MHLVLKSCQGPSRANSVVTSPALPLATVEVVPLAQVLVSAVVPSNQVLPAAGVAHVLPYARALAIRASLRERATADKDQYTAAARVVPGRANRAVPRGLCRANEVVPLRIVLAQALPRWSCCWNRPCRLSLLRRALRGWRLSVTGLAVFRGRCVRLPKSRSLSWFLGGLAAGPRPAEGRLGPFPRRVRSGAHRGSGLRLSCRSPASCRAACARSGLASASAVPAPGAGRRADPVAPRGRSNQPPHRQQGATRASGCPGWLLPPSPFDGGRLREFDTSPSAASLRSDVIAQPPNKKLQLTSPSLASLGRLLQLNFSR